MKKFGKILVASAAIFGTAFAVTSIVAAKKKKDSQYENDPSQKNPMEGKKVVFIEDENDKENADGLKGHLEAVGDSEHKAGVYEKYIKRGVDIVLSFGGLVVLSPVLLGIAVAIKIDDPGPVLFTQKRVGENKKYFKLHKFRSMKMSTPHDRPTHMLENPEHYITKVGKFIRAHSLDELPQIWDIFIGNMSVIGPRPGLWNQDFLTAERDKYGANDIKPGLTGWAQINGRDELEIPVKAKLDGEYAQKMGLAMDAKVFLKSLGVFGGDDSVVEGGTGEMKKNHTLPDIASFNSNLSFDEHKKILIAGAGSYIGESFKSYMTSFENYIVDSFSTMDDLWKTMDFSKYDVVYDVAGIAHVKETDENRDLYYKVNRDLAVEIAKKAKVEGVKQFIYLSSMSVYGLTVGRISNNTASSPMNAYGKSKLEAEELLWKLKDDKFTVSVIRPPMVYGEGCKGNYQTLKKFALKFGFFPNYDNERSMLHVDNLSAAIRGIIHNNESGLYFPQDLEYVKTYDMVKKIAEENGKKFRSTKLINVPIKVVANRIGVFKKVFGTLTYDKSMNVPSSWLNMQKDMERVNQVGNMDEISIIQEKIYKQEINVERLFSVVVPCYNNQKYLNDCLLSILTQNYNEIEIIVVDDHSKEFDINAVIDFVEENKKNNLSRVVVYQNPENYGTVKSLNNAIKRTDGSYLKIVAADDALYGSNSLGEVADILCKSSSELVLCDVMKCDSNLNEVELYQNAFLDEVNNLDSMQTFKSLCIRNRIFATGVFFKKAFFNRYGYFNENYRLLEDWPTWMTYLLQGGDIHYYKVTATKYRMDAGVVANCNLLFLEDRRRVFYEIIKPQRNKIGVLTYYKAMIAANIISNVPLRKAYIRILNLIK